MSGKITFVKEPFGEGASRYAHKGRIEEGTYAGFKKGTEVVLKVIKPKYYNEGLRLTEDDIEAQKVTRDYAKAFNSAVDPPKPIFARVGAIEQCGSDKYNSAGKRYINEKENMLIEQMIYGEYEKFNSNSGWTSGKHNTPDTFSHWTWVQSNGEHLVVDLQGHRGRPGGPKYDEITDYYLFTDPVVMTKPGGVYGQTDLGEEGIKHWFACHECNDYCRSLGLEGKRPNSSRPGKSGMVSTKYHYR